MLWLGLSGKSRFFVSPVVNYVTLGQMFWSRSVYCKVYTVSWWRRWSEWVGNFRSHCPASCWRHVAMATLPCWNDAAADDEEDNCVTSRCFRHHRRLCVYDSNLDNETVHHNYPIFTFYMRTLIRHIAYLHYMLFQLIKWQTNSVSLINLLPVITIRIR